MEKDDEKKDEEVGKKKGQTQPPNQAQVSDIESESDEGKKKGKQPVKNLFRKVN